MKVLLYKIFICFFLVSCASSTKDIKFLKNQKNKFYPYKNSKSTSLKEIIKNIEKNTVSYVGEFIIKIKKNTDPEEKYTFRGKIFFDEPSKKMKILFMDQFFGISFSKMITDGKKLSIKIGDNETTQDFGYITLIDPKDKKELFIPFPIIYTVLSNNILAYFTEKNSFFDPIENRVVVKLDNKDEFYYQFSKKGIETIEFYSNSTQIHAVSNVTRELNFPPKRIIGKVLKNESKMSEIEIVFDKIIITKKIDLR